MTPYEALELRYSVMGGSEEQSRVLFALARHNFEETPLQPYADDFIAAQVMAHPTYIIEDEMMLLAQAAGDALPEEVHFKPADMPSPHGYMFLPYPIEYVHQDPTAEVSHAVAVSWATIDVPFWMDPAQTARIVCFMPWQTRDEAAGHYRPPPEELHLLSVLFPFMTMFIVGAATDNSGPMEVVGWTRLRRTVLATWLLMNQRVARTTTVEPSRALRRRAAREARTVDPVQVIHIRRPETGSNRTTNEGGSREWTQQWIVGGHWRNHWHPKEQRHVPTWIAPYVKGPADKPLVVREKVVVWDR